MRIAYLVPEFPAQTHIFFWREIEALRSQGVELELLSTRRPSQVSRHAFAAAAEEETRYLFPPQYFTAFLGLLLRPLLSLRMLAYALKVENSSLRQRVRILALALCAMELLFFARKRGIAHVHGHSCADVAHLLALASLSGRLPFSLTLHGDLPVYGTGHAAKFAKARFVAVVTYALQKQVHDYCAMDTKRLPVIRMGVDTKKFQPLARGEGQAAQLRLVTVARLAACKGHVYALRALRRALDSGLHLSYTIVGEGEERPQIEAEIRQLKLEESVRLVGTAGEKEVLGYLQAADAFVLSSVGLGEAAPVSVMEAMACGLPAISSIIGGTPELIDHGVDGFLIPQEDVAGFAAAFLQLGQDSGLRLRMGQAARSKAEQKFSADAFARQLYENIKEQTRGGASS